MIGIDNCPCGVKPKQDGVGGLAYVVMRFERSEQQAAWCVQRFCLTVDGMPSGRRRGRRKVTQYPLRISLGSRTWHATLVDARAQIPVGARQFKRSDCDAEWIVETWI